MGDNSTTTVVVARQPGIGHAGRMPSLQSLVALTKDYNDRPFAVGFSAEYDPGGGRYHWRSRGANTSEFVGCRAGLVCAGKTDFLAITGETYDGNALGIFSVASGEAIGAVGYAQVRAA